MPIDTAVQAELVKNAPAIITALMMGLASVISSVYAGRKAGRAARKAQEAVDETVKGNAKLDAVHEEVKSIPSAPAAMVAPVIQVQQPPASTTSNPPSENP